MSKKLAPKQRAFLASYRETASITKAAAAASIDRTLHYDWLANEAYAAAFNAAKDTAAQTLEDEAVRRAHEGTLRPVFHKGKPCGVIRDYSDTLLTFLLKAYKPERFRDNSRVEVTGSLDLVERLAAGRARLKKANAD